MEKDKIASQLEIYNASTLRIMHHFLKTLGYSISYDEITTDPQSLLTIVAVSTVPGLQIKHPTKGKWIPIETLAKPEEFIVLPGVNLCKYTNNAYPVVPHRLVSTALDRFSLVFYCQK